MNARGATSQPLEYEPSDFALVEAIRGPPLVTGDSGLHEVVVGVLDVDRVLRLPRLRETGVAIDQ